MSNLNYCFNSSMSNGIASPNNGCWAKKPSAVELIESTKNLYVKTEALKQKKIGNFFIVIMYLSA